MMDVPYRVEEDRKEQHWVIKRNEETLCATRDVSFAYHLVELLNAEAKERGLAGSQLA
jgi:hypothetical protein